MDDDDDDDDDKDDVYEYDDDHDDNNHDEYDDDDHDDSNHEDDVSIYIQYEPCTVVPLDVILPIPGFSYTLIIHHHIIHIIIIPSYH